MATKNQLSGGAFQDVAGNVLANGHLLMVLSQDGQVNGDTQISAGVELKIQLDDDGNVQASPAQSVWGNDAIVPSGTFYTVSAYTSEGQLVWGPNAQQIASTPSPYNIGDWVPSSVNTGAGGGSSDNAVSSVFGRTGAVIAEVGDYSAFYAPLGSGGVTSAFGRTGAVVGENGDYTAAQVTNAADVTAANTFSQTQTFNGGLTATYGAFSSYITAPNLMNSFNGRSGTVVPVTGDYNVSQVTGAAPTDSPTFTGVPVAPTAASGTNTTQLATTAFVQTAAAGGVTSFNTRTGAVTPQSGDYSAYYLELSGGTLTGDLTLPGLDAATVAASSSVVAPGIVGTDFLSFSNSLNSGGVFLQTLTAATSGTNYNSPGLLFESTYWNGSASATDTWTIQTNVTTPGGTNPLNTLSFVYSGSSGGGTVNIPTLGVVTLNAQTIVVGSSGVIDLIPFASATSGANFNSATLQFQGNYWTGSANAQDEWNVIDVMGGGANPTSTLTFSKVSGTSGVSSVSFGSLPVSCGTLTASSGISIAGSEVVALNSPSTGLWGVITVPSSPATITATLQGHYIVSGGTASSVVLKRGIDSLPTGLTNGVFPVSPADAIVITYTVVPTVYFIPR